MRAVAWAVALFMLAAWLGRLELLDPDESRHAEIAREMLAAGSYLTPVLEGEPYYDKPAAYYWLLAASLALVGTSELAVRLPSALAALWTILVTARFAERAFSPAVATATVIGLATTLAFAALGRTVVVDMPFTAALTTAFVVLGRWWLAEDRARAPILPFYVCLALAALLKGPAALVLGGALAATLVVAGRDRSLLRDLRPLRGALVVAALTLPWYLAAWLSDPDYIETFLFRHNFERYLRPLGPGHHTPWYYYLVALPAVLLPWTPLTALAAIERLRTPTSTAADRFCLLWAAVVLAFFLPARTRALTYLLPALAPLVCVTTAYLCDAGRGRSNQRLLRVWTLAWTGLFAVAAPVATLYALVEHPGGWAWRTWLALLPAAVFALAIFAVRRAPNTQDLAASIAGCSVAIAAFTFGLGADVVSEARGVEAAAAIVRASLEETDDLVSYRTVPHALAFYSRRTVDETKDVERARAALAGPRPGALLTRRKRLAELGLEPLPDHVILAWSNALDVVLLVRTARRGEERVAALVTRLRWWSNRERSLRSVDAYRGYEFP